MYVVIVDFEIVPGCEAQFRAAILANARDSLANESGCRQFDVCTSPDDPARIFLYEIYADKAAFDAHLVTPHFVEFNARSAAWTAGKTVRFLERVEDASRVKRSVHAS